MSFPSASPILPPAGRLSVKKRKRDATTSDTDNDAPTEIDTRPFAVRPAGNQDLLTKATAFTPVCLLQRAQLPLAFLDPKGSGSRFFASHIQTLESFDEHGVQGKVIVAEQKEERRLYIVERVAKRVYALCRLGAWITSDALNQLSSNTSADVERAVKRKIVPGDSKSPWWMQAAVDIPKAAPRDPIRMTGRLQLSEDPHNTSESRSKDTNLQAETKSENEHTEHTKADLKAELPGTEPRSQDPLEELAKQYLEALYLSRMSLAYFAKGPLSRARATFTAGSDLPTQVGELIEFLRNVIIPATTMDKKYRDNITALIKDLPPAVHSQEDKQAKSRRKKKFKPKRDKSGLFAIEPEYLENWWRAEDPLENVSSSENADATLRRRVSILRARETYLQIIIILEALYLESTNKNAKPPVDESQNFGLESQSAETQSVESPAVPGATKRKGKKPQDLHSLLDILLDRLCIWQSVESHTPAKSLVSENSAKSDEPGNELRDFCVEVIVPFFLSRLPKEAALVNKKLGGPSPPSQEKRQSTSSRSRPGEPAVRSRSEKQPRKPLSRVATETLNHAPRAVPGLHRSSTDTTLIKREDSQPTLSSIPAAKPPRQTRDGFLAGFRQIDLVAKSAAATERLRKKKETEAQVREAINNARKPNRPQATKEVAARADERFAQSLPANKTFSSRSARLPGPGSGPGPHHNSVHVAATPKRARPPPFATQHYQSVPASHHSSQPSIIPSSSARHRADGAHHSHIESTPAVPRTCLRTGVASAFAPNARRPSGVQETPTGGAGGRFASPEVASSYAPLHESPSARRTASNSSAALNQRQIAATPVKAGGARRGSFGEGATPSMGDLRGVVGGTPLKKGEGLLGRGIYGEGGGGGGGNGYGDGNEEGKEVQENLKSIYDVWDDDDYEELA